jgi:hypothetical protein
VSAALFSLAVCDSAHGQEYLAQNLEDEIESALDADYGTQNGIYGWEYDEWGDEWEYHFPGGEIEFEPQENAESTDPEEGVRQALAQGGDWDYQYWEGGWEYQYPGGEVEYDPSYFTYEIYDYDYPPYYDYYYYDGFDDGGWEYGYHIDYDWLGDDDLEYGWYYTDDWYDTAEFDEWYG